MGGEPLFDVLEVERFNASAAPDLLRGSHIDVPNAGDQGDLYVMDVVGWVVGLAAPVKAVELVYHGRPIRACAVRGVREDVAREVGAPAGTECVFHARASLVGMKEEFELIVQAVLDDGRRAAIGRVHARHRPLRTGYEPQLRPIMLTCLGRSGTTWLMRLLASHPEIVVYRRHPYESAFAKYWVHMLRVLAEPSNHLYSSEPTTFHNYLWYVGNNPYHDEGIADQPVLREWFGRDYVERLAAFCQSSVDSWYQTVAATQGQAPPTYFAEKHLWPNYIPVLMWELYPSAKEVFMVRDFRDMTLSMLAFDRKRGFPGFGRPEGATDAEYVRGELSAMAHDISRSWESRRHKAHLVRYEDLVLESEAALAGLFEYLELDAGSAAVRQVLAGAGAGDAPELSAHRTSAGLRDSVGRWRREPDQDLVALCEEAFAGPLELFGYERAPAPA
jgi:hypothetical protein